MRILIDLQGAQSASRHRGIGRYTLALAEAMARNSAGHEVLLLLNGMLAETIRPIRDAFAAWVPAHHIHVWQALAPVNANEPANATRRAIATLIREEAIRHIKPDVVHITSLFDGFGDNAVHSVYQRASCPVAVTFYDAIPLIQAATYLDNDPVYRRHYLACVEQARQADLLLAISESARQEAITHFQAGPGSVVNMSSAVDACFQPRKYTAEQMQAVQGRLRIHKPFVMYSGATDERKNHRGLITAFAQLPAALREQHQLVLAGGLPEEHKAQLLAHARDCKLTPNDVIITGRISDDDMVQLYNLCALYVFASWHEGFGLPALEAMACGAATIGANTTSVPEVIGWERALFDPHSPADIAQKMAAALTDSGFHHALQVHALTQAARFSWDKTAQSAIAALEALVTGAPTSSTTPRPELLTEVAQLARENSDLDLLALSQAMARNSKPAKPQLLVDVSELIQYDAKTGIQRVVRSILHEWLANPPSQFEVRAVYATAQSLGYRYADRFTQRFTQSFSGPAQMEIANLDAPIDYAQGDVFLALDMQPQVQVFQEPYYQRLRDQGVSVRFVLYDLLPITLPQYFPEGASSNHARWLGVAAKTDGLVCISNAVAQEFEQWRQQHWPDSKPQVDWFHMGADIANAAPSQGLPPEAASTLSQLAKQPTFLMVGTLEPRKGHAQVLDAAEGLWQAQPNFNLVLVGKQGWSVDALAQRLRKHPQLGQRLFWLVGISDEFLGQVYAQANCLVAASFGEGFGLPLIEAAQCQMPIIARDIPVFREVAGDSALYFDASADNGLQRTMGTWLDLHSQGRAPPSNNMYWQNWKASAGQLMSHISKQ